jgi:hypothetical protein
MTIELTAQQQQALDTGRVEPLRIVDPRTNSVYVLLPLQEYENIREIAEDERRQKAIHAVAVRNALRRMDEEP